MRPADMMTIARILLPALVLVAACTQPPAATLEGRTFLSTSVTEGGAARQLVAQTRIRLSFADGLLGASVGCNSYGATYRIADGRLVASGGSMTEMGCDEDRAAQDEWLFSFLGSSPSITLDGNDLVLERDGTVITLLDREIADPDLALIGPTWTVTSIISDDAVASLPDGVVATFKFLTDGRVEVNTGCNTGGGRYAVDGAVVQFAGILTTLMSCDGNAGQLEAAVMIVLQAESVSYQIEAGNLTLMAGNRGLGLTGE